MNEPKLERIDVRRIDVEVEDDWEDERPVHRPHAPEAPIPGTHHYQSCSPDHPRVNADGICEDCGGKACPNCGLELCKGDCGEDGA